LTNGHYHGKLPHEKDCVNTDSGPRVTRSDTFKWAIQDTNINRGYGVYKEEGAGPSAVTDSSRIGKEPTNQVAVQVEGEERGIDYSDQRLFSPDKLAEGHKSDLDDVQKQKEKQRFDKIAACSTTTGTTLPPTPRNQTKKPSWHVCSPTRRVHCPAQPKV